MQDVLSMLAQMKRPRLLMRAAKSGATEYARNQHLKRLLGSGSMPKHGAALLRLMELEKPMDLMRRNGDASYSKVQHVDLLIAMVGEARLLRATQPN